MPTLLVADESATIQRVVELTFAAHGISVVAVSDGQQAVDYLASTRPNAALISAHLQKRDGFEVIDFMRRQPRLQNVPALLMAGAFDAVDEERARSLGAAGVLYKPLEPAHVINRVKELIGVSKPAAEQSPQRAAPTGASMPAGSLIDVRDSSSDEEWSTEAPPGASGAGPTAPVAPTRPASDPAAPAARVAPVAPDPPATSAPGRAGAAGELRRDLAESAPSFGPADAFAVLLAEEQGEVAPPMVPQPIVELSDNMVERIADRVAERLMQSGFGEALRGTVHDVSERLVREEIQRIRAAAQAQGR